MLEAATELTQAEQEYFDTRGKSGLSEEAESGGVEQAESATDEKPQGSRMVPHGALHAEREEHKKTRAELQQLRTEAARMQQALQRAVSAPQAQGRDGDMAGPPDPRKDFVGFTRWQVEEINRLKGQVAEDKRRQEQERQAAETERLLWQEWNQAVEQTRTEHADLDNALNFLAHTRDRQLGTLGDVDPRFQNRAMRERQIQAELRAIVVATFQQGKNPAKAVYDIARAYGYGGSGESKFARLHDAQAASRTLTATRGKEAGDPMLLETVANLSEEEFARWYENNRGSFRKMFGG